SFMKTLEVEDACLAEQEFTGGAATGLPRFAEACDNRRLHLAPGHLSPAKFAGRPARVADHPIRVRRARPRGTASYPGCGRSSRPAIGVMARRAAAIAAPSPIELQPMAPRRATPSAAGGAELRGQGIRAARKAAAKLMKERAFVRRRQRRPDRWRNRWQLRGQRRAISVRRTLQLPASWCGELVRLPALALAAAIGP
uniref:hypothetical protein n=1 Tax=Mangrovicoccus sp. HB161399 TaxID=2720392 RepID=UPI001C130489